MYACGLILLALSMPAQRWLATVSGRILDYEHKPMANAHLTYTQVGSYTNGGAMEGQSDRFGARILDQAMGKVYKAKTDKRGEFVIVGMAYGVYKIAIIDSQGKEVYSGRRIVGDNADHELSNRLEVDLSAAPPPGMAADDNNAGGKKTKEQIALARQENANAAAINRLIVKLRSALDAQDWRQSTDLLQQLLALDPNRWEFYQNLGTIQSNLGNYEHATQSYAKGVEVAEKTLAKASDQAQAKTAISDMMISEGDAYLRLDKTEEALSLYAQAAAIAPNPASAHFHICNARENRSSPSAAIEACNQAIASDPNQHDAYSALARAQERAGQSEAALTTYSKGIELARKELVEKPDSAWARTALGQMLNAEGNLYASMRQYDQAIEAFAESAKTSAYAALPYFNLCAMYYNINRMNDAAAACDQAIASDPTLSDAYYLKAASLFGRGTLEQGKFVAPGGTREALNQYLQFAPFGSHAQMVREMIEKLDAPIDPHYQPIRPVKK